MKSRRFALVRPYFRISLGISLGASLAFCLATGCASGPTVEAQAYAKLNDSRVFEYDFPTVWKGIEGAVRGYKITDRDPDHVDAVELKQIRERTLETDWIYGRSNDKYIEFKVNGSPRKQYLQTRFKFKLDSRSVLGGVEVHVKTTEEIEMLKSDGSPDGYETPEVIDTSRAHDLLEKINQSILSQPS